MDYSMGVEVDYSMGVEVDFDLANFEVCIAHCYLITEFIFNMSSTVGNRQLYEREAR